MLALLITPDPHLLTLKTSQDIRLIGPEEFRRVIRQRSGVVAQLDRLSGEGT